LKCFLESRHRPKLHLGRSQYPKLFWNVSQYPKPFFLGGGEVVSILSYFFGSGQVPKLFLISSQHSKLLGGAMQGNTVYQDTFLIKN
jgi:hypothetical protein